MANLRVGLIGLGMMGRHHARVIREVEGVDLVAVADAYGDPHGVAKELTVLHSVEELIAAGIDMAVAAVPTGMHEEVGLALAAAFFFDVLVFFTSFESFASFDLL